MIHKIKRIAYFDDFIIIIAVFFMIEFVCVMFPSPHFDVFWGMKESLDIQDINYYRWIRWTTFIFTPIIAINMEWYKLNTIESSIIIFLKGKQKYRKYLLFTSIILSFIWCLITLVFILIIYKHFELQYVFLLVSNSIFLSTVNCYLNSLFKRLEYSTIVIIFAYSLLFVIGEISNKHSLPDFGMLYRSDLYITTGYSIYKTSIVLLFISVIIQILFIYGRNYENDYFRKCNKKYSR